MIIGDTIEDMFKDTIDPTLNAPEYHFTGYCTNPLLLQIYPETRKSIIMD